jgi:hypothetical protein
MPVYNHDEMRTLVGRILPNTKGQSKPVKREDSTEVLRTRQSLAEEARKHLAALERGDEGMGL